MPVDFPLGDEIPIGMYLDTKDFKFVNLLDSPELKSALTTMRKYYKAGYVREDVATLDGIDNIKTGKWLVDREITQPYAELGWSRNAKYDFVTRPMHYPVIYTSSSAGSMMAISSYSKNPERAMMFLNLLNTDVKLRNMIQYGLEGTHYKKLEEPYIEDMPAMQESYAQYAGIHSHEGLFCRGEGSGADDIQLVGDVQEHGQEKHDRDHRRGDRHVLRLSRFVPHPL